MKYVDAPAEEGNATLSDAVWIRVFRFQPVKRGAVGSREFIDFALPFIELAQRRQVAIERRQAAAVFKNRGRQQVRIDAA